MAEQRDRATTYRDHADVIGALKKMAALRGRSLNGEVSLAVRYWLRLSVLAQLRDPIGRAEAVAQGVDAGTGESVLEQELAEMRAEHLGPTERVSVRDVLREAS